MRVRIGDCKPSQLVVSAAKLRGVLQWFDRGSLAREPADLAERVVSHDRSITEWVGRCRDLECY